MGVPITGTTVSKWFERSSGPQEAYRFLRHMGGPSLRDHGLSSPKDVALDPTTGDVVVLDWFRGVVARFTPEGKLKRQWGGQNEGPGKLDRPSSIAIGPEGQAYVSEAQGARIVEFSPEGRFVRSWGKRGKASGEFDRASCFATGHDGNTYVADKGNSRLQFFSTSGALLSAW